MIGQVVGASLEYAAKLGKPLMVYVFSDGSVSADTNTAEDDGTGTTKFRWQSDDSQTAASFVLVYSPTGRPALRNGAASQQLGAFKATGAIDTASSPFANSVTQLAEMVVLNYLALHGEEAKFNTVLTNPGLGLRRGRRAVHRVQPDRVTRVGDSKPTRTGGHERARAAHARR